MNASDSDLGYRRPPERKSMHAQIVRDLGMRIVSGEYKPGERLPAEASLCAAYDVSRPVLREATRVLVAKGLVVSKQRAGAIVRARSDWHLLDPDVLYWLIQTKPQREFVETLLTVRRIFEPAAAALAARVATPEKLEGISEAYAGMEAASTPEELLEPDLAFHRRIAEATGNDLLAYIGNMLSLALRESIKLSSQHPNTHALSLPRHKAILTAILNHDSLAARQATLVQLEETREDISHLIDFEK
ncbi:FadR/GntR family transcriptional regulator [Variovorax sp. YR216]|uniref:FadR/GntR family transcriptional regulator n=1 Tax=Variovorax sp. YR216 TaxID=1882828 RepID=UPI00089BCD5D|nr:FadR/GntR family transcriptional regulator [Variovorax sp. YR216]SEB04232.1 transcriptional regulator, GntR family [Variovorax sp. YR216]